MLINSDYNKSGRIPIPHHVCIANIDEYDKEMLMLATLCVMMASAINTSNNDTIYNSTFIHLLRDFQSAPTADYTPQTKWTWKRCYYALVGYMAEAQRIYNFPDGEPFPFAPVRQELASHQLGSPILLDRYNVQILKDVYYLVTGSATPMDQVPPPEKSSRAINLPYPRLPDEHLAWSRVCPQTVLFPFSKCALAECDHFAGIFPGFSANETL